MDQQLSIIYETVSKLGYSISCVESVLQPGQSRDSLVKFLLSRYVVWDHGAANKQHEKWRGL